MNSKERHNFILGPVDTDSVSICKPDMSIFTDDEQQMLLDEINSQMPKLIKFAHDGYFKSCLALKAKNYILQKFNGEKKIKGSAFKTSSKEPILKCLMEDFVDIMLNDNDQKQLLSVYMKYINKALNPKDIKEWSQKKTITKAILNCAADPEARLNERKIYDAINGRQVQEGEKLYVYPAVIGYNVETKEYKNGKIKEKRIPIEVLKDIQDYNNDHDADKLLERVYATVKIFANVLDMDQFIDYSKPKNRQLLERLPNE